MKREIFMISGITNLNIMIKNIYKNINQKENMNN